MHLSALILYPVKGMRGIPVARAELDGLGLALDRRWMLVDEQGRFLSQRRHPRLVRIRGELSDTHLRLSAPGAPPLALPLDAPTGPDPGGGAREVALWSRTVRGLPCPEEQSAWFARVLETPCTLLRLPRDGAPAPPGRPAAPFSDGYPLHLVTTASLADLNRRLPEPVSHERFRPNLLVQGAEPYAEDGWSGLRVGGTELRSLAPCVRCAVTTVDPDDGSRGPEPLRTLAGYRAGEEGVTFGTYLAHAAPGTLRVGDAVTPA